MFYWIIFIGFALISYLVQANLQNKFKKYAQIPTRRGLTGKDVAEKMLQENGAKVITLGKRILRTETVALNVLSSIMYEFEQ